MKLNLAALLLILPALGIAQQSRQSIAAANGPNTSSPIDRIFMAADLNHDGRLTREEANNRMPVVFEQFARIDMAGQGSVSLEQVRDYIRGKSTAANGEPFRQ